MSYTYWYVEPSCKPPFKKWKRYTRGRFMGISEPMGCFGFRYAIFRNRCSEVLVPAHDLTDEAKAAIREQGESAEALKGGAA